MRNTRIIYRIATALLVTFAFAMTAQAQETASEQGPRVLTTDLMKRQKSAEDKKIVSFVIMDDDLVTAVWVNNQPEKIEPARTVTLTKEFGFKHGRNLISVEAQDERGNKTTVNYLVAFGPGVEVFMETAEKKAAGQEGWTISASLDVRYEKDDNPTLDLGLPIKVGDLDIQGIVDDTEQPDNRISANAMAIALYKGYNIKAGGSMIDYSQEKYRPVELKVAMLGTGYSPGSLASGWLLDYLFMDIDVGGTDYAQYHTASAGYQWSWKRKSGSFSTHSLAGVYTYKDFAAPENSNGGQEQLAWTFVSLDAEQLDSYRQVLTFGNNQDGTDLSEYSFAGASFDWNNKWKSGVLFDIGFALQYRTYKTDTPLSADTPLGAKRVDLPLGVTTALGWEFVKNWSLALGAEYNVNVSNKSPWVRTIQGVTLKGSF